MDSSTEWTISPILNDLPKLVFLEYTRSPEGYLLEKYSTEINVANKYHYRVGNVGIESYMSCH